MKLFELEEVMRWGDICGGIIHEVNNPMTVVTGQMSLLSMQLAKGEVDIEKFKTRISKIENSLNRANILLNNARKFPRSDSRLESREYSIRDLCDGIEILVGYTFKKRDVHIEFKYEIEHKLNIVWEEVFLVLANFMRAMLKNPIEKNENEKKIIIDFKQENEKYLINFSGTEKLPSEEDINIILSMAKKINIKNTYKTNNIQWEINNK